MADSVSGWDTIGPTSASIIDKQKLMLEFTGVDGEKQNVFLPIASFGPCVSSDMSFCLPRRLAEGFRQCVKGGGHRKISSSTSCATRSLCGY